MFLKKLSCLLVAFAFLYVETFTFSLVYASKFQNGARQLGGKAGRRSGGVGKAPLRNLPTNSGAARKSFSGPSGGAATTKFSPRTVSGGGANKVNPMFKPKARDAYQVRMQAQKFGGSDLGRNFRNQVVAANKKNISRGGTGLSDDVIRKMAQAERKKLARAGGGTKVAAAKPNVGAQRARRGAMTPQQSQQLGATAKKQNSALASMGGTKKAATGEEAAATKLQALARGRAVRNKAKADKKAAAEAAELAKKEKAAATKLQALQRGRKGRQKANAVKEQKVAEEAAATKLQALQRGRKGRETAHAAREKANNEFKSRARSIGEAKGLQGGQLDDFVAQAASANRRNLGKKGKVIGDDSLGGMATAFKDGKRLGQGGGKKARQAKAAAKKEQKAAELAKNNEAATKLQALQRGRAVRSKAKADQADLVLQGRAKTIGEAQGLSGKQLDDFVSQATSANRKSLGRTKDGVGLSDDALKGMAGARVSKADKALQSRAKAVGEAQGLSGKQLDDFVSQATSANRKTLGRSGKALGDESLGKMASAHKSGRLGREGASKARKAKGVAKKQKAAEEAAAATKLQALQRGRKGRAQAAVRKQEVAEEAARDKVARALQRRHRGGKGRETAKAARAEKAAQETAAATKMQALARGRAGRNKAKAAREQKAAARQAEISKLKGDVAKVDVTKAKGGKKGSKAADDVVKAKSKNAVAARQLDDVGDRAGLRDRLSSWNKSRKQKAADKKVAKQQKKELKKQQKVYDEELAEAKRVSDREAQLAASQASGGRGLRDVICDITHLCKSTKTAASSEGATASKAAEDAVAALQQKGRPTGAAKKTKRGGNKAVAQSRKKLTDAEKKRLDDQYASMTTEQKAALDKFKARSREKTRARQEAKLKQSNDKSKISEHVKTQKVTKEQEAALAKIQAIQRGKNVRKQLGKAQQGAKKEVKDGAKAAATGAEKKVAKGAAKAPAAPAASAPKPSATPAATPATKLPEAASPALKPSSVPIPTGRAAGAA